MRSGGHSGENRLSVGVRFRHDLPFAREAEARVITQSVPGRKQTKLNVRLTAEARGDIVFNCH